MNIGIIGCGNMANSIIYSISKNGKLNIFCYDIDKNKMENFFNKYKALMMDSESDVVKNSKIIILAVKPKDIFSVLEKIKDDVLNKIIVSIVAGISIDKIKRIIGEKKIARIMPNINISVEKGVLGICFSQCIDEEEKRLLLDIFENLGIVKMVDENMMDAITALFGSGPAFVSYFIDAYIDAAIKLGFSKSDAVELVLELFYGTIVNMKNNMLTTSNIKDMVTSPGGTTIEGIVEYDRNGLKGKIIDGIIKAYEKSKNIK